VAALCGLAPRAHAAAPAATTASVAPAAAVVEPARVPAAGRRTALLKVAQPGRYAIAATSAGGTQLRLVDRMAGLRAEDGLPGERDGRVDALLDTGVYQVVTQGDERAAGDVALDVRPFRELSVPQPSLLVEGRPVAADLGDREQRSWWLQVDAPRRVLLEAAGRNLSDLRLFRDGGWLVDAEPAAELIEPEAGRPLRLRRIAARLEPGLYLLTAYGGPDEPWPAGGDRHPLHLRTDVPRLGDAGRARHRVGPFGRDHYLVPANVTYARLELPEAAPALLEAAIYRADEGDPLDPALDRSRAAITKQSREPAAELGLSFGGMRLLTVTAPAGQPYVLQHFERRDRATFQLTGRYWLATVHSGDPRDNADATVIVTTNRQRNEIGVEPVASQVVEIGAERGWARRCNLLGRLTVFFHVTDKGSYEVLTRGTAAKARFEPFLISRPRQYREPPLQSSGSTWELEPGWHVLTVVPDEPGIVEAAVRPVGALDAIWDLLDPGRAMRGEPVRPAVTFPGIPLEWGTTYTAWVNERPGIRTGIVLRALPIDVVMPLPLALVPGEEIVVPARTAEAGTIRAETEAGDALEIRAGEGAWVKALDVTAGTRDVRVRNAGRDSVLASLRFDAARLAADAPPPALPPGALAPPPVFPELTPAAPVFFDLRAGGAVFSVRAAEPAFHTVESTGLLATSGTLRSRLLPSLASAAGGGTGRNFLVGAYLDAGEYQLNVAPVGASRGHLGVRLRRAPLREGGTLREGVLERVTAAPAEGIVHRFEIAEAGTYRLVATAVGRVLPCRLEDGDGWPIEAPGAPALFVRRFEPGRYRLLLPPEAVGSRRVTGIERVVEPPRLLGHGPHPLALNAAPVELLWEEPAEGAPRTPDRWEFALPAPAGLTVTLTGEMQAEIRRRSDAPGAEPFARIPPGRAWSGKLPAGDFTLEAVCSRRNNRAPYSVSLQADALMAGLRSEATAPAAVTVAVGAAGLYEFASSGPNDVRARLVDASGAVLAEQEDRPDDWNVQFAARLAPGTYRLELQPTGASSAKTTVSMRALAERAEAALAVPGQREVRPGDDVALLPLALPVEGGLLALRVRADETVGAALERSVGAAWEIVWSGTGRAHGVEVPLPAGSAAAGTPLRVRLWSLDRRGSPVRVAAAVIAPRRVAEKDLAKGVAVAAAAGVEPAVAVAVVALDRPGLLRLDDATRWRAGAAPLRPLADRGEMPAAAPGATLWLAAELPAGARDANLRGARVALTALQPVTVELPADGSPVACDVARDGSGPVLVTVEATTARPGIAALTGARPGETAAGGPVAAPSATATAPVGARAASVLLDPGAADAPLVLVWRADAGPAAPATVRVFTFSAGERRPLGAGAASGLLETLDARRFTLPRGAKRVRLTLAAGVAAALVRDGRTESAHDAGGASLDETLETAADTLVVVNAGGAPAPWSAEILLLDDRALTAAIAPGRPFVARFATAGTHRVGVAPAPADGGAPTLLRTSGCDALALGADGRIAPEGAALEAGGVALLRHGPGLCAAWLERPGAPLPGIWGAAAPLRERALAPPESVRLEGPSLALLARVEAPTVLHLRTGEPLIAAIRRPAGPAEGLLRDGGAAIDLLLAPGTTALWLRRPDGADLRGAAEALFSPVTPIGEGLASEALLAPGTARYYSFEVTAAGPLGVGLRAVPDTATCRLLDAAGRELGSGIVQMPRLEPGRYLLAVRAPDGGGPVAVRPALAGLVPPGSGPPEEIIRRYLQLERGGPDAAPEPESSPAAPPREGD
jgi:hypothetical protein